MSAFHIHCIKTYKVCQFNTAVLNVLPVWCVHSPWVWLLRDGTASGEGPAIKAVAFLRVKGKALANRAT